MKRGLAHVLIVLIVALLSSGLLPAEVSTYPAPPTVPPSDQYRVEISQNGATQESFVYITRAQWRSNRSKTTSWTAFSFRGKVTVKVVKLKGSFSRCRVLPTSRHIRPRVAGSTASFDLDRPEKLAVEFDESTEHPLLVFADPPETNVPRRGDPNVLYFGPGVHDLGAGLHVKSGQTVYLAGGAYVKGRIVGRDAANVRIIGRGVLSGENYVQRKADGGKSEHFIILRGWKSSGALVEGITLVNSPHYNITIGGPNATVRNVKMISWWFSTDGVGLGDHGRVENCFFKVNDDALKLYLSDMQVRGCVIWQMENGAPFQISWNMGGDRHGFVVRDIDVIRVEHQWNNANEAVFDSIHGGSGHMHDYLFEDIRIENADWRLVNLTIAPNEFATGARSRGRISGLRFRNITVDGPLKRPNVIKGWDSDHRISDVTFENLKIDGKFIRSAAEGNFTIDPETTRNVRFTVTQQAWRWDAYFRESLAAIRDWETILARSDAEIPQGGPAFPVPEDGKPVAWINPVPALLRPPGDRQETVRLQLAEGRVEVARVRKRGTSTQGRLERSTVAPGETVTGYRHPGGGGKDRWYHAYGRRLDRLTAFRPVAAPFAVCFPSLCDFSLGANELAVELRGAGSSPVSLTVDLRLLTPRRERKLGSRTLLLDAGSRKVLRFAVDPCAEGGKLLLLTARTSADDTGIFRIPLLVHVEEVSAVLESVRRIIEDRPDPKAAQLLAAMDKRAREALACPSERGGAAWRSLFEEASGLRDRLLLEGVAPDAILFVKRKPFDSEQPFMDAHHLRNRPGGGIYRLSPVRPEGTVTAVVDSLGEGIYRDVHLHWSGERFLFSFGNGSDQWDGKQSYHIYEAHSDGSGLRQLTFGPKNDCEPFYLRGGRIGFTSDRSEHFVMCGGNRHAPNLFVMNADGSGIRQLSFNVFNDFNPTVLPDGRILYSRWEYNERSVTSLHNPFTIHPDGTMMAPFYGNATIRPNVVMFPRPVPGTHKITALLTAHHGQTHGAIAMIDTARGLDGPEPLTLLTPGVPVTGEKARDSRRGWYSDPFPLSESTYLCSFTPTVVPWRERSWALYAGDRHGNLALVYRDLGISCAEPVPLVSRPRPHALPAAPPGMSAGDAEAALLLLDAYRGLQGVPRGAVKHLRILEDVPRKGVRKGGVITTSKTRIYTIKRVFGTVPVEPDGSALFVVPADRNVYFELLDAGGREIQRMRSVVCLKPGETRSCIGCHEPRTTCPPNKVAAAASRVPSRPSPPPWGTRTISFLRDVQPVLNARCVRCHAYDRAESGVILTDDLTDQFTVGYEELLPYISVADAMRWDNPDDVLPRPPYTYGSGASRLVKLLDAGHRGVRLSAEERLRLVTWIDANGVYYDRYETRDARDRHIFTGAAARTAGDVHARRCAPCHGGGGNDTWWRSLNRRDASSSRALQAPLARAAGGWGLCDEDVFADRNDADYRRLREALVSLRRSLIRRPRADLASIRGTAAERQDVRLPPPPERKPRRYEELPDGDWVPLCDLAWESARAGWTPNGDGLPRIDRDVEGNLLRAGSRRYRKGIGTHAPSEITYRLDSRYTRFAAAVAAVESGGTVVFQVRGDGKLLYDSGRMSGPRGTKDVDISVAGVRRLRLVVTDGADGINCDMANWAGARLRKAP